MINVPEIMDYVLYRKKYCPSYILQLKSIERVNHVQSYLGIDCLAMLRIEHCQFPFIVTLCFLRCLLHGLCGSSLYSNTDNCSEGRQDTAGVSGQQKTWFTFSFIYFITPEHFLVCLFAFLILITIFFFFLMHKSQSFLHSL